MGIKRRLSIFLALVMILSLLSGCAEPIGSLDHTETVSGSQGQTTDGESGFSEMWKDYAQNLGFSLDKIQQQTVSGEEMADLLDELVAYAAPDKLTEWKNMYKVLRGSTEPLNRYDTLSALYLALMHIGGDYGELTSSIHHLHCSRLYH